MPGRIGLGPKSVIFNHGLANGPWEFGRGLFISMAMEGCEPCQLLKNNGVL